MPAQKQTDDEEHEADELVQTVVNADNQLGRGNRDTAVLEVGHMTPFAVGEEDVEHQLVDVINEAQGNRVEDEVFEILGVRQKLHAVEAEGDQYHEAANSDDHDD